MEPLTADRVRELWTKTYNDKGKPDWSHIWPYYDEKIVFRDSIQEIRGLEEFKSMIERLARRSGESSMKILRAVQEENIILFEWEMTINFKNTRSSVLYGSSRLTLDENSKIIEHRDYFDLWGDIFDNIPGFGIVYRKFMKKMFG